MSNSVEEDAGKAEIQKTPTGEREKDVEGSSANDGTLSATETTPSEPDKTVNGVQIEMTTPSDTDTLVPSVLSEPSIKADDLPVTSTPKAAASGAGGDDVTFAAATEAAANANAKTKKSNKKGDGAGEGLLASAGRVGSGIEIIRIKERHGQFRKAVPIMPLSLAIVLCLVNVVLPGIGTLFSAFTVFCCGKTEFESKGKAFSVNVIAAILQIITVPILVGWIWSIIWGVTFITSAVSKDEDKDDENPAPQQV